MGTFAAASCSDDDGSLAPIETPAPPADIRAIVETAVRDTLQTIPSVSPVPSPDIEATIEKALQQTMETMLEDLFLARSADTENSQLPLEPTRVFEPEVEAAEVAAVAEH